MDEKKLSDEIEKHLSGDMNVTFHSYDKILSFIDGLYSESEEKRTWVRLYIFGNAVYFLCDASSLQS